MLANLFDLAGFEYMSVEDIREEIHHEVGEVTPSSEAEWSCPQSLEGGRREGVLRRLGHVPIYAADAIVRRADALQQTPDSRQAPRAHIGPALALRPGLRGGARVRVKQGRGRSSCRWWWTKRSRRIACWCRQRWPKRVFRRLFDTTK